MLPRLLVLPAGFETYSFSTPIGFSVRSEAPENLNRASNPARKHTHASSVAGAPGRIRTHNNGSEDRCDIHFTTGAGCRPHVS